MEDEQADSEEERASICKMMLADLLSVSAGSTILIALFASIAARKTWRI